MEPHMDKVSSERHAKRYESHKYWGRKPGNVVRHYIEHFTQPGDTVADIFGGSGVTAYEAYAAGRNALSVDLNPVAVFLARQLVARVDCERLEAELHEVLQDVAVQVRPYYSVLCEQCTAVGEMISTVYQGGTPTKIYFTCPTCGSRMKSFDPSDRTVLAWIDQQPIPAWHPTTPLFSNSDVDTVDQLFTRRNLIVLSLLLARIKQIDNPTLRDLALYTFTANLAFGSKLMPVNEKRLQKGAAPTGIWGVKRFWIPELSCENNVLRYFKNRMRRTLEAKRETESELAQVDPTLRVDLRNLSATDLRGVPSHSVDYIFCDPPYGASVPYFELSTLWAAWLDMPLDYRSELIYRDSAGFQRYENGLRLAFAEAYRILKPGKRLSVTFHTKIFKVWAALMKAITAGGFRLETMAYQEEAEIAFTQSTIARRGSLRGDFIFTFVKDQPGLTHDNIQKGKPISLEQLVLNLADTLYGERGRVSLTDLYTKLIPELVNRQMLEQSTQLETRIESVLQRQYRCVEADEPTKKGQASVGFKEFYWVKRA